MQPNTLVVLVCGSPVVCDAWLGQVPAVLVQWYAGMGGGHALADVLTGQREPTGRLPCVFPAANNVLPLFSKSARRVRYGLLHGQRWLDAQNQQPTFYFGHGLGYSKFAISNVAAHNQPNLASIRMNADVQNCGHRAGQTILQVYASLPQSRVERAPRWLVAYAHVALQPGQTQTLTVDVPHQRLAYFDLATDDFVVEPGSYRLGVGWSANPNKLLAVEVLVPP